MKALIATSMYPHAERPALGTFVRTQVESLRHAGLDVDVLFLQGGKSKYLRGAAELRRRLDAGRFDLVHAHYSYVGVLARTQWQVPVVVTYHGDDLLGTVTEDGTHSARSRAAVAVGKALARAVEAVIVQTDEMAAKLRRRDVHVIPHEVDLDLFRPVPREAARAELGLHPHRPYLLFAASPAIPVKRFPLASDSVELLRRLRADVELLVIHAETQQRLALYMSACDALVFTSYQEGSPNIVKQAMACNLPIVSTDVGDVRGLLGGADGCAICAPDARAFAEALDEVLMRRERTNTRRRVRHLASAAVAARVIAVYERVLATRRVPLPEPVGDTGS